MTLDQLKFEDLDGAGARACAFLQQQALQDKRPPTEAASLFPSLAYLLQPYRVLLLVRCSAYLSPGPSLSMRCAAVLKAVDTVALLYPNMAEPARAALKKIDSWLRKGKSAGSRVQRELKRARNVVASHKPPLIPNLPRFAKCLMQRLLQTLTDVATKNYKTGATKGGFNKGG